MENKLYTEEQVKEAIRMTRNEYPLRYLQDIINDLTPIEIPSDEEIENLDTFLISDVDSFIRGAKWMRDKIGNNK
jgi:hypothetical protein